MPISIIGNAFTKVWNDRDRILLTQRTRERLQQWGYSAEDIPALFQYFDKNGDGQLQLDEFHLMMREMKLGIVEERILSLFNTFDADRSGGIDLAEFTRVL